MRVEYYYYLFNLQVSARNKKQHKCIKINKTIDAQYSESNLSLLVILFKFSLITDLASPYALKYRGLCTHLWTLLNLCALSSRASSY